MRDNIVTAVYNGTGRYKTSPLYQYDYGQKLVIGGVTLPSAYEVHFSNSVHGNATTQIGNADGVTIPDMYLLSGQTVYAWLFLHSGESDGETEFIITIPVIARAKPTDQEPTPVQQYDIAKARKRADGDFSEVWGAFCKRDDRQIQTVTLTNVFGELLDHKSMGGFPVEEPEEE